MSIPKTYLSWEFALFVWTKNFGLFERKIFGNKCGGNNHLEHCICENVIFTGDDFFSRANSISSLVKCT